MIVYDHSFIHSFHRNLRVSDNKLGNVGASVIASLLADNALPLTYLDASRYVKYSHYADYYYDDSNYYSTSFIYRMILIIIIIIMMILFSTTFRNRIEFEGGKELGLALKRNRTLQHLNVRWNDIGRYSRERSRCYSHSYYWLLYIDRGAIGSSQYSR